MVTEVPLHFCLKPQACTLARSIYQEVWKSGKLYEYPVANLDNAKSVMGPLQDGWGATTDQTSLILSDGSATLSWVDPATMAVTRTVSVSTAAASITHMRFVHQGLQRSHLPLPSLFCFHHNPCAVSGSGHCDQQHSSPGKQQTGVEMGPGVALRNCADSALEAMKLSF